MRKSGLWQYELAVVCAALLTFMGAGSVFATTATSQNYQMTESEFGASSNSETCSAQYCARSGLSGITSGSRSTSTNSSADFGSVTPDEPMLEVIVESSESDLGIFTTDKTAHKTTTVRVRNYLSDGYTLQITGDPPKYAGHMLATPSMPTASTPGTEQFGINLTDNSDPDIGQNPVQVPSSQTSYGEVEDDYKIPNHFMYSSGDVVAMSHSESGRTDYTISMIINVATSTPAGRYIGDFSAVVIPIY